MRRLDGAQAVDQRREVEGAVVLLALDGRGTPRQVRMALARARDQALERPGYPRRPGVDRCAERLLGAAREELVQARRGPLALEARGDEPGRDVGALDL